MEKNSRKTIHAGVNFILAPFPDISSICDRQKFHQQIEEYGILIDDIKYEREAQRSLMVRKKSAPLEITLGRVGPQVGQLLIVAPFVGSLEIFGAEASGIAQVFMNLWPKRQVISCDATIRDLYDSTSDHAFKELWEERLKQPPESIKYFGRPILGGGLRFVMPPTEDPSVPIIEVKIESYIKNTKKIFLETVFSWQMPQTPEQPIDPEQRIEAVDNFIRKEVVNFVMEEK